MDRIRYFVSKFYCETIFTSKLYIHNTYCIALVVFQLMIYPLIFKQAVSDFRKEWLNFDLSNVSSPINGVIKPGWNKGVGWVAEAIADSPETIQNLGKQGWQKLSELASEPQTGAGAHKSEKSKA